MNRARETAKKMLGKGFLSCIDVAQMMGFDNCTASQAMQAVRRSSYYDTEEQKEGYRVYVKVTAVLGEPAAEQSKTTRLLNSVFKGSKNNENKYA